MNFYYFLSTYTVFNKIPNVLTRLFVIIFLIISSNNLYSQEWIYNSTTGVQESNYFNIQENFRNYWSNRDSTIKGKGFKAGKRWLYHWKNRVDENGRFPAANANLSAFDEYLNNHLTDNSNDRGVRSAANWTSLGPNTSPGGYGGNGRVNSIAFHPTNTSIIYIGAAGGGLWKSSNGGTSWTPLTESIGSMGVSGIVVVPSDPNIIYINWRWRCF